MKNWKGLLLLCVIGILFMGNTSYAKTADDRIEMGIYIDKVNDSGMNAE